jgi:hypothetical protein
LWSRRSRVRVPSLTLQLVVGEADFFADEPVGEQAHHPAHAARPQVIEHALGRGDVLFVGSSLTEPGVAASKHLPGRRCALVLPSDLAAAGLSASEQPEAYALALDLIARRYLHLGVVPILVDFEQQVPQMLVDEELSWRLGRRG